MQSDIFVKASLYLAFLFSQSTRIISIVRKNWVFKNICTNENRAPTGLFLVLCSAMQSKAVLLMLLWVLGNPKAKPQGWWPVPHSLNILQKYACIEGEACVFHPCRLDENADFWHSKILISKRMGRGATAIMERESPLHCQDRQPGSRSPPVYQSRMPEHFWTTVVWSPKSVLITHGLLLLLRGLAKVSSRLCV